MPTRASSIFLFFVAIPLFIVLLADLYLNPEFVKKDDHGWGRVFRVYFLVYILAPFALLWYFVGLLPGLLSVPAIVALHLLYFWIFLLLVKDKEDNNASWIASYFLAYMLVPFLWASYDFGLSAGAALTLALWGLSALWNAIMYTSPRYK